MQELVYLLFVNINPCFISATILIHIYKVATFTGLTLGGALGMDRGMHKLRESLPPNSTLLQVIRENDELKKETLLSGPIKQQESTADLQMELIEDQLSKELTEDQSTTQ